VGLERRRTDEQVHVRLAGEDVDIADSSGGKRRVENVRRGKVDKEMKSCGHNGSNQSMKPTAPWRYKFRVFATTPWISSRCPASLVRFASSRSRTPAVMLFNATRGLSLSPGERSSNYATRPQQFLYFFPL